MWGRRQDARAVAAPFRERCVACSASPRAYARGCLRSSRARSSARLGAGAAADDHLADPPAAVERGGGADAWECVRLPIRWGNVRCWPIPESAAITLGATSPAGNEITAARSTIHGRRSLGEARCRNNLGIRYSLTGQWDLARRELSSAITLSRATGTPDLWGIAAVNLGVVGLKCAEYDRARELFGEALALFAGVKNSERQLYALYNLAHLDRDRGEHESAAELYDAAGSLAQRVGQSDVEIGASAGAGLSLLEQGKLDSARSAHGEAAPCADRVDWFQGGAGRGVGGWRSRADGRMDEGGPERFSTSRGHSPATDVYTGVGDRRSAHRGCMSRSRARCGHAWSGSRMSPSAGLRPGIGKYEECFVA